MSEPLSEEASEYADRLFPCTKPCDSFGICNGCYERVIFLAGYNFGYREKNVSKENKNES